MLPLTLTSHPFALAALITTLTSLTSSSSANPTPAALTPRQILPSGPSTSYGPPPPPHTAIFTTTLAPASSPTGPVTITAIATITVIMREAEPLWPTDGVRIPGTVISAIGMTTYPANGTPITSRRRWTESATWTLSGNSRTQSPDPQPTEGPNVVEGGGKVMESTHTTWSRMYSTYPYNWAGLSAAEWFHWEKVTLRERGDGGWPDTITRTGETVRFMTHESWGTYTYDKPYSSEGTTEWARYTTMVRIV